MDGETRKAIKNEIAILKKKEYSDRYAFEIEGLKQSLVDRLPSLRKQLEEQEEIRKTNAIEAARLEEERKRKEAEERQKAELGTQAQGRGSESQGGGRESHRGSTGGLRFQCRQYVSYPYQGEDQEKDPSHQSTRIHAGIPDVVHA